MRIDGITISGGIVAASSGTIDIQSSQVGVSNSKVTVTGTTITLTAENGNTVQLAYPKSGVPGEVSFANLSSSITLTLPSSTVNQRLCGINTSDGQATFANAATGSPSFNTTQAGIEFFLYYINDGTNRIGVSRSPLHTHVPADYAHTSNSTTITVVGSAATAWNAMIVSDGSITNPALATCVCLGPVMTATVDGSSATAGRFSSMTLTTDYLPRWNNRRSTYAQHTVRCDASAGYGSTDTFILKFTSQTTTGVAVQCFLAGGTVAAGSIGGTEILVTEDGLYKFMYTFANNAGAGTMGLSKNSSQRTTNIGGITTANVFAIASPTAANRGISVTEIAYLTAGTVIRPHNDNQAVGTPAPILTIEKIGWGPNV